MVERGRGRGRPAAILLVAAVTQLGACRGEPGPESFVTRDSAGVEIVESFGPSWGPGEGWSVAPEPTVRIGVVEGEEPYRFSELTGALRLADGTLVAADRGPGQIRFYDPTGGFLRAAGGRGGGPGEFTDLIGLGQGPEGRIWAWDLALRRITWLDGSGRVTGIISLPSEPPVLNLVGPLPGGSVVFRQLWGAAAVAQATRTGFRRDPAAFVRFDSAGELLDTLGLFPGREVFLTDENGRGVMSVPPVGRNLVGAVLGPLVVVGTEERFELEEYEGTGALRRIVRIPVRDLAISPDEVEAVIRGRIEAAPPDRREALRTSLEAAPVPATRPAYRNVLTDPEGNLWVAEWNASEATPQAWTVLDPRGRWLGPVSLPKHFEPFQIGADWILGVQTDDLDVQYLALYRLIRSPLSS